MIANAKRPPHEPGHPLYMNFYKEDVLHILRDYQTILQFVFAHYATLEKFYKSKVRDKMNPENFPGAWGLGNGTLRMKRSEFVVFCENFGIVGSFSRVQGVTKPMEFTRNVAIWVFSSAKNGLEGAPMCQECLHAELPGCEHMTFREFVEAVLRCAIILFPCEGMQMSDLDAAPITNFDKIGMLCAAHVPIVTHTQVCTYDVSASNLHLFTKRFMLSKIWHFCTTDWTQQMRLTKLMTPSDQPNILGRLAYPIMQRCVEVLYTVQIDMSLPPPPPPRPPTRTFTHTHSSTHSSMHSPMMASPPHPRSLSADPILETVCLSTRSSPMPDSWVHGKLSPISQRMKRRGPPGFRQSLPAILTYSPSPHMVKPQTPQFRSWSRQYQPGSPGVKYDLLPIRPL